MGCHIGNLGKLEKYLQNTMQSFRRGSCWLIRYDDDDNCKDDDDDDQKKSRKKMASKSKNLDGEYINRLLPSRGQTCLLASERARQTREGEDFPLLRLHCSLACTMLARATIVRA